jgi:hypothetical protein
VVSLFSVRGRAVPWLPLIVYLTYSTLVCFAYTKIPGADQLEQFKELSTVTNTIGAPQNAAALGAPLFVYALVLVARPALNARAGTRRRRLHAGWQLGPPPPPLRLSYPLHAPPPNRCCAFPAAVFPQQRGLHAVAERL